MHVASVLKVCLKFEHLHENTGWPRSYAENHVTFPIQIRKLTVQICGNFWVTQYVMLWGRCHTRLHNSQAHLGITPGKSGERRGILLTLSSMGDFTNPFSKGGGALYDTSPIKLTHNLYFLIFSQMFLRNELNASFCLYFWFKHLIKVSKSPFFL